MKQIALALVAIGLLVGGFFVVFNANGVVQAQHQPPPPTPKGQLGGAPRLTPLIGGETTVTPVPPTGTPAAGTEVACNVAPRSLQGIASLALATPTGGDTATIVAVPDAPADAGTVAAVTDAVARFVTCLNDGDQLRALAYMTDDAVSRSLAATGWDEAQVAAHLPLVQPREPDQQIHVRSISEVTRLQDGRVVATIELTDPAQFPLTTSQQQWLFEQSPAEGRWLIAGFAAA
jgi:hypothetical protein